MKQNDAGTGAKAGGAAVGIAHILTGAFLAFLMMVFAFAFALAAL